MALNPVQERIATLYCGGDMDHVQNMEEAENCGDTLFLFLLREAHDAESLEEFLGMLNSARTQLSDLVSGLGVDDLGNDLGNDLGVDDPGGNVNPRVLITVKGGVADYIADRGVDVEIFDRDNFEAGDSNLAVPSHFADLAKQADVPVCPLASSQGDRNV